MSTTHRLFAAIDFDDDVREAIGREQARVGRALSDAAQIRWVRPEQMHLTLVFLAAVPEKHLLALTAACSAPIAHPPFTMAFGGVGVFPPRSAPRVVWLGAIEGAAGAATLQQHVAARIEALGIATERRRFRAHVTLGRCRTVGRIDAARLRSLASTAAVARLEVREVVLYESRLSPSGSTYLCLARAPLTARP